MEVLSFLKVCTTLQELAKERKDVQQQKDVLMHAGSIFATFGVLSSNVSRFFLVPFDFGQFLDRFYLSRVGVRVLIGQVQWRRARNARNVKSLQHIMLHHPQEGFIGIIQKECVVSAPSSSLSFA